MWVVTRLTHHLFVLDDYMNPDPEITLDFYNYGCFDSKGNHIVNRRDENPYYKEYDFGNNLYNPLATGTFLVSKPFTKDVTGRIRENELYLLISPN